MIWIVMIIIITITHIILIIIIVIIIVISIITITIIIIITFLLASPTLLDFFTFSNVPSPWSFKSKSPLSFTVNPCK